MMNINVLELKPYFRFEAKQMDKWYRITHSMDNLQLLTYSKQKNLLSVCLFSLSPFTHIMYL